ncbi:Protein C56G2.3 [Aphelenchoides avenae]|nr:Protein C56G2.3 [Aphelenchus avenae]
MTNVFRPSAEFIKRMSSQYGAGALERYIDRVQKEFEIYEYFATHPPKELDDHDWKRQSISERITHFDFLAKIKYEDERAAARRAEEKRETEERLAKERERYDAGGMGYGPGLYQLLPPPRRSQRLKNLAAGCRVWKSLRLNEQDQLPTISWDMQFMGQETVRQQYELAGHLKTVIGLNYELKNPFPMQLINIDPKVVTEEMFQEKIGHYGKYVNQVITPDRLTSNPLEKCASHPGTIYISK